MTNLLNPGSFSRRVIIGTVAIVALSLTTGITYHFTKERESVKKDQKIVFDKDGNIKEVITGEESEKVENQKTYAITLNGYQSLTDEGMAKLIEACASVRIFGTMVKANGCYITDLGDFHGLGAGVTIEF